MGKMFGGRSGFTNMYNPLYLNQQYDEYYNKKIHEDSDSSSYSSSDSSSDSSDDETPKCHWKNKEMCKKLNENEYAKLYMIGFICLLIYLFMSSMMKRR